MQGILGDMQRAEALARQRDASHGMLRPEPSTMQRIGSQAKRLFFGDKNIYGNDPLQPSVMDSQYVRPEMAEGAMLDVVGGPMTFAGTGSKLADRQLLKKAKSMLSGKSPKDQIWDEDTYRATGWYKDLDGQWKFEIDDSKVKVDKDYYKKFRRSPVFENVHDFMQRLDDHDPVFHEIMGTGAEKKKLLMPRDSGYPELDDSIVFRLPTGTGTLGEMHPLQPRLTGVANPSRGVIPDPLTGQPIAKYGMLGTIQKDMPLFRDTLLHEGQHHMGWKEGHGIGGSPEMFAKGGILEMRTPTQKDLDGYKG